MKRRYKVGLATLTGASLALGSAWALQEKEPEPAAVAPVCPAVDYQGEGVGVAPNTTKADQRISNLGAYMLGMFDRKCQEGVAGVKDSVGTVQYSWRHKTAARVIELTLDVEKDTDGALHSGGVRDFSVRETTFVGATTFIHAQDVETGWLIDAGLPTAGENYAFSGNTGASIAEKQAGDIADIGKEIIFRAANS